MKALPRAELEIFDVDAGEIPYIIRRQSRMLRRFKEKMMKIRGDLLAGRPLDITDMPEDANDDDENG